jgi:hypothetical protein
MNANRPKSDLKAPPSTSSSSSRQAKLELETLITCTGQNRPKRINKLFLISFAFYFPEKANQHEYLGRERSNECSSERGLHNGRTEQSKLIVIASHLDTCSRLFRLP